eukprot:CAMPEP_0202425704 /NCGR_PEP_ID=MMETSP1345-20130828/267_1 /ASSEMBLY_ACC=CAM_ASM_000843 /TAXON_ID=342563 /ORGANISM="Fabrea Fabrea salina" /LENGTH=45 /DNA_ID= /DNA_START= /DNA_END= /DNA_ORIENTATION=
MNSSVALTSSILSVLMLPLLSITATKSIPGLSLPSLHCSIDSISK